jgi:hypothetical protein
VFACCKHRNSLLCDPGVLTVTAACMLRCKRIARHGMQRKARWDSRSQLKSWNKASCLENDALNEHPLTCIDMQDGVTSCRLSLTPGFKRSSVLQQKATEPILRHGFTQRNEPAP